MEFNSCHYPNGYYMAHKRLILSLGVYDLVTRKQLNKAYVRGVSLFCW